MKKHFACILLMILSVNTAFSATFSTVKGNVKDAQTDEELIGASIWVKEQKTGTIRTMIFIIFRFRITELAYKTNNI